MDLKKLDEEARLAAIKSVKNMVQRPSQLEKLDQYRMTKIEKKLVFD